MERYKREKEACQHLSKAGENWSARSRCVDIQIDNQNDACQFLSMARGDQLLRERYEEINRQIDNQKDACQFLSMIRGDQSLRDGQIIRKILVSFYLWQGETCRREIDMKINKQIDRSLERCLLVSIYGKGRLIAERQI